MAGGAAAGRPATLQIGTVVATPGDRVSGYLEIPSGVDAGTRIPITLVDGSATGPVVALIAGTHGYEYPPMVTLQRVRRALDPTARSGSGILI